VDSRWTPPNIAYFDYLDMDSPGLHLDSIWTPSGLHLKSIKYKNYFFFNIGQLFITSNIYIYSTLWYTSYKSMLSSFCIPVPFFHILLIICITFIIIIVIDLVWLFLLFLFLNNMLSVIEKNNMQEPVKVPYFHAFKNRFKSSKP